MIRSLFPTPVKFDNLNEPTNLLENEICNLLESGYANDLRSGVDGTRIDLTNELLETENPVYISKLLREIQSKILVFCKEINIKPLYLVQSWININPKHSINKRHSHPGSTLSGAYYIKYPSDADSPIGFYRSREFSDYGWNRLPLDENDINLQSAFVYFPKENDLLLFPSFVEHDVWPNKSDKNRISLSFNCKP